MTTANFITDLFCRVDDALGDVPHHSQAHMPPSEVVSLSLLFVLEGGRERTFYRWLERDDRPQFLRLPACTRLFRLFGTHQGWADRILVEPTVFGVAYSYGVELTHPYREQCRRLLARLGRKGVSTHRWIVGGTRGVVLNKWGLVCAWGADTANVHDSTVHPLVARLLFCRLDGLNGQHTRLQHMATAGAINLRRLDDWWTETARVQTRVSPFAALAA